MENIPPQYKAHFEAEDQEDTGSACCDARLIGDICSDCKEHSGPYEPDEETEE